MVYRSQLPISLAGWPRDCWVPTSDSGKGFPSSTQHSNQYCDPPSFPPEGYKTFPSVAVQWPKSCLGHLISVVSRSHSNIAHSVGLFWKKDRSVAAATTYATPNKHKVRTSMLSAGYEPAITINQTAAEMRLRPLGHRGRPENNLTLKYIVRSIYLTSPLI